MHLKICHATIMSHTLSDIHIFVEIIYFLIQ